MPSTCGPSGYEWEETNDPNLLNGDGSAAANQAMQVDIMKQESIVLRAHRTLKHLAQYRDQTLPRRFAASTRPA
jgi:hypothetical protein